MVRVVVAARTNRVSARLPVIVSDGLNGYPLSGDDGASGDGTLPPNIVRWLHRNTTTGVGPAQSSPNHAASQ